ncbi:MAG: hypothetical protein K9L29_07550 [Spirochaetales bacterium]|nr:hypothetical protein [Spirochaetales bacterium]
MPPRTSKYIDAEHDPLPEFEFSGQELVFDIVYTPPRTVFLERAEKAGCSTITGLEMLRAQGLAQFELFTGRPYPEGGPYPEDNQKNQKGDR